MSQWFEGLKWAEDECQRGNEAYVKSLTYVPPLDFNDFDRGAVAYLQHRRRLDDLNGEKRDDRKQTVVRLAPRQAGVLQGRSLDLVTPGMADEEA